MCYVNNIICTKYRNGPQDMVKKLEKIYYIVACSKLFGTW